MHWLSQFGREALTWVYPDRCEICLRIGRPPLCDECNSAMVPLESPIQRHFAGSPLDFTASVFPFDGVAAKAIKLLKYGRATSLARQMSDTMAAATCTMELPGFDFFVPVPIHWSRLFKRGFNQSVLLCEALPREKVAPELLTRFRRTRPQVGLPREQRLTNLKGAFRASVLARGASILLIDDVTTTGGTATACAEALKAEGAALVGVLTFCGEGR